MATEIVYQQWCDICLRDDHKRVEVALSEDIAIGGKKARHVDLCADHAAPFASAIELLGTYGTTHPEPTASPTMGDGGNHECAKCGKRVSSRGSLSSHYRRVHDISISEAEGKRPRARRTSTPQTCDICGVTVGSKSGLGVHRSRTHGIKGPQSRDDGDQPELDATG